MMRPCVVLSRPMTTSDPALARDADGYLFPEVLRSMVSQGLASEVVFAVPDYAPEDLLSKLDSWGFEIIKGPDAPQSRLVDIMDSKGWEACTVLTSYACLIDGDGLDAAWRLVEENKADAVFTAGVISPKEFGVMNRKSADTLAEAVEGPLPPFMFQARLEEDGRCHIDVMAGLESATEMFVWSTFFAGDDAALPVEALSRFIRAYEPEAWFSRQAFTRLLCDVSGVSGMDQLEQALGVMEPDEATKLAANINFLRKLAVHMPEHGERFLEIGCHDIPLLASLSMNRFDQGIAVEPFMYSEEGVTNSKELASTLSRHAPSIIPLESNKTAAGNFTGLEVHESTIEDLKLPDDAIDFCWSKVVLEHVADVSGLTRELFRVLKPGGSMVHRIDFRDHGRHDGAVYINFDFLRHSRSEWAGMDEETNLWRVNDFTSLWEETGFIVEVLERKSRVVKPSNVHPSWEAYEEDDLYCYDALIKATKPALSAADN